MNIEKAFLIYPRGFCAGVDRAIRTVEDALEAFGAPIYVKHEIVHNKLVCDRLRSKGTVFIEDISEVPEGSICIFSAHGIANQVREEAKKRKLITIDATCPLVTKIHLEVARYTREGKEIIYIGHKGHPEAVGVMSISPSITQLIEKPEEVEKILVKDPNKLVYLTQTTLSVDECKEIVTLLKKKFPSISSPPKDDICYATTNRQMAIKTASKSCDIILVVGSKNSSNSNKLVETAIKQGIDAYLIDTVNEIKEEWFEGKRNVGISAGASAPKYLVDEIAAYFKKSGAFVSELNVLDENMKFTMPYELNRLKERNIGV